MSAKRIGFVSTRFAGTDGVSLESAKWAEVLEMGGHEIFWYSGRSDRDPAVSHCIPEAYFGHPENVWIQSRIWGRSDRAPIVTERIEAMAAYLKTTLYAFVEEFSIEILIPENSLTIPMHLPLGVALTRLLAETRLPCIAHHHDFYWERTRFSISAVRDYLDMAFPPSARNVQHAVINRAAQQSLSFRKGVSSMLVPNVFEFEKPAPLPDQYSADVRSELGLTDDDIFVLQPTRIVPRKGIEHAIKLVGMLDDSRYKLVISHDAGDEGFEYQYMLEELAREEGVELLFIGDRVSEVRQRDRSGRKMYTLWDLYPHADLVTYPSIYEGFGNALLEAFYFKKPVVINRYSIFVEDIEPHGFQLVVIDGFVTRGTVKFVKRIMEDEVFRANMVEHNYIIAHKYFGYEALRGSLFHLINRLTGWQFASGSGIEESGGNDQPEGSEDSQ